MYTQLGVLTKGTIIEVNVSELGMVTAGGKVVFGKYAQITNNPENDGCINAVLRKSMCTHFCSLRLTKQSYSRLVLLHASTVGRLRIASFLTPHFRRILSSRLSVILLSMVICSICNTMSDWIHSG